MPKKPVQIPFWQKALFYVSFVFLALSVFALLFIYSFSKKTALRADELNRELANPRTGEEINLEKEILRARQELAAFALLSGQRKPISRVFVILEKITHPQVFFSVVNLVAEDNKIRLSGKTDNFQVLGQQNFLFKGENSVKEVNLVKVGIGKEGGIDFDFEIIFDPAVFNQ